MTTLESIYWQKLDILLNGRYWLHQDDDCYFMRSYTVGCGYDHSKTNQLIYNLKKKKDKQGTSQWFWKEKAVEKFAHELSISLESGDTVFLVPTSKTLDEPKYDPRCEMIQECLTEEIPSLRFEVPIKLIKSYESAHEGGPRNPSELEQYHSWVGFDVVPETLFVIDDVLTKGGHFRLIKDSILTHHPEMHVIGMFWARAEYPSDPEDDCAQSCADPCEDTHI